MSLSNAHSVTTGSAITLLNAIAPITVSVTPIVRDVGTNAALTGARIAPSAANLIAMDTAMRNVRTTAAAAITMAANGAIMTGGISDAGATTADITGNPIAITIATFSGLVAIMHPIAITAIAA